MKLSEKFETTPRSDMHMVLSIIDMISIGDPCMLGWISGKI